MHLRWYFDICKGNWMSRMSHVTSQNFDVSSQEVPGEFVVKLQQLHCPRIFPVKNTHFPVGCWRRSVWRVVSVSAAVQGFHGFRKDWHRFTHFPCLIFSRTTPRHLVSSKCSKMHFKAMFFRNHVANVARFKVLKMLNCVPGKLFDVYVLVGSLSQMPKPSKGNRSYKWEAWLTTFKGQFICGYSCLWMDRHLEHSVSTTFQRIQLHPRFQTGENATLLIWRECPTLSKHDWCNWYLFLPFI